MSVWFCIPSCRAAAEAKACLDKWRGMGYKIALLRQGSAVEADLLIPTGEYLGWARSTNILAREVLRRDPDCAFVVGGGDDYVPDFGTTAGSIAVQCGKRFMNIHADAQDDFTSTYGVMQPTGDRWGDSPSARMTYGEDRGAILDRVAGSPWMGREFCERAYLGNGPMWDGYHHMFADEELCAVAEAQGVYWRRPDLTQYHEHYSRIPGMEPSAGEIYSREEWGFSSQMFNDRKWKGFPGSEPICR